MDDKYKGTLTGLAIGDTLGTVLEFEAPGTFTPITGPQAGGPFNLPLGYWTDDTSMALCLADSLLAKGGYDSYNVMDRYWRWYAKGYRSSTGVCFDIGRQVAMAIGGFKSDGDPVVRTSRDRSTSAGNGSIMRLAPIVIASHAAGDSLEQAMELARLSGRETHYSLIAEAGTALFGAMIYNAFSATDKKDIFATGTYEKSDAFKEVLYSIDGAATLTARDLTPSGYIVDTLACALWAFFNHDTFADGALAAVNLGGDADTIGAVYGELAGAYYGYESIPAEWRKILHQGDEIADLAVKLGAMKACPVLRTRFEEDGTTYAAQYSLDAVQSDITTLDVDAIVNAANTSLFGGSGVCGAIFDAAGYDDMTAACTEIGHCEYGDAVVTPGFALPAQWVIHTVGPIYGQHDGAEPDILKSCYWQSLRLAGDMGLASIAFPLISTGIYGYPLEDAIRTSIEAITEFFEDNSQTSVSRVTPCAFSADDKAALDAALAK